MYAHIIYNIACLFFIIYETHAFHKYTAQIHQFIMLSSSPHTCFSQLDVSKIVPTEVPTPAVQLLESTEKVANAITSSLTNENQVVISRRNLGKQSPSCTHL